MLLVVASAAFVGFVHSLAPAHWIPVVLVSKARGWTPGRAALGALVAASGHIAFSVLLGVAGVEVAAHVLEDYEVTVERYAALAAAGFGLLYGLWALKRHHGCSGHGHHGPDPDGARKRNGTPMLFLLSVGFSPCVAALPVFGAATAFGGLAVALSMLAFALGVLSALVGATLLVSTGLMKLDHPFLEHYGDAITGFSVFVMGIALFLFRVPHVH